MTADAFLFWFLAILTLGGALSVILMANPIYSALSLAFTMICLAGVFVSLNAYFIAGVQAIVYAGAVTVLFVMVLMLFDLKHEGKPFSPGVASNALKLVFLGIFSGLLIGVLMISHFFAEIDVTDKAQLPQEGSRALGVALFQRHLFSFEALGVLLLIVAVGTVSLARSKGGTHAKH